jgi:uncharacterized protein YajQ (UPF0234 family)
VSSRDFVVSLACNRDKLLPLILKENVMPSFDIVSNVDQHEVTNAIDQANREVSSRFDFKDTNARLELAKDKITIIAPTDFQVKQVDEILKNKLAKRNVDIRSFTYQDISSNLSEARQLIKDSGLKVQASIQGDQIRVTGKKRDDLQEVIAMLKQAKTPLPLQYVNFRD